VNIYGLDDRGLIPRKSRDFCSQPGPNRLSGPPGLSHSNYRGLFPSG